MQGARLLNHSGETNGFTADLTMLPDAGLGVAVLSNAQRDRHFVSAVRTRVLELVFGQPMEADALYARRAEQERQAAEQQLGRVQPRLDPEVAAVYPGVYNNPALGEVSLAVEGGRFLLDAGSFVTELRSGVGDDTWLFWDPPWAGMLVELDRDAAGNPAWRLVSTDPDQPGTYAFSRKAGAGAATPALPDFSPLK